MTESELTCIVAAILGAPPPPGAECEIVDRAEAIIGEVGRRRVEREQAKIVGRCAVCGNEVARRDGTYGPYRKGPHEDPLLYCPAHKGER
jgi:hypothetical protein